MITPEQMAALAEKSLDGSEEGRWLARFEKDIEQAAKKGHRSVFLCFADCGSAELWAVSRLWKRGFRISRHRENSGGCMQDPAYYAAW